MNAGPTKSHNSRYVLFYNKLQALLNRKTPLNIIGILHRYIILEVIVEH